VAGRFETTRIAGLVARAPLPKATGCAQSHANADSLLIGGSVAARHTVPVISKGRNSDGEGLSMKRLRSKIADDQLF